MPKLVCVKCEVELKCEKNGVRVAEMFQQNTKIYKLWDTDMWKCPICGYLIIAGFAPYPFAEHYKDNCEEIVQRTLEKGGKVVYDKEVNYLCS